MSEFALYNPFPRTYLTAREKQTVVMLTCVPLPKELVRYIAAFLPELDREMDNWRIRECLRLWALSPERALRIAGPIEHWDTRRVTDMSRLFFIRVKRSLAAHRRHHELVHMLKVCRTQRHVIAEQISLYFHKVYGPDAVMDEVIDLITMDLFFKTFNVKLGRWNTANVTTMAHMFHGAHAYNEPIGNWNVSRVTDMTSMFQDAYAFDKRLQKWDVSNVRTMANLFHGAKSFKRPLHPWNVSNVTDMSFMFALCESFNQPIGEWNVSQVTNMESMFFSACNFNQPVNAWNVARVTSMERMFSCVFHFNQPVDSWNVSSVTNMNDMFYHATHFNQSLASWDVSNVRTMARMFFGTNKFDKPLHTWNVFNVTTMEQMFFGAYNFNQPLHAWNAANVTNMRAMFERARWFNNHLPSLPHPHQWPLYATLGCAPTFDHFDFLWTAFAVNPETGRFDEAYLREQSNQLLSGCNVPRFDSWLRAKKQQMHIL